MLDYLLKSISLIEVQYPNSGTILLGDFNMLDTSRLRNNFKLKQVIKFPTREQNKLDLILTNLNSYYDTPIKLSPFGLSDHVTVEVQPKVKPENSQTKISIKTRDLRPTKRLAMRFYLQKIDLQALVDSNGSTCDAQVNVLEEMIRTGMDIIIPMTSRIIVVNEPPWMSRSLKKKICARQSALERGDIDSFRSLRNEVNRERKICRAKYYDSKVKHLQHCKPATWWREVKKLSGMSSIKGERDLTSALQHLDYDQEEQNQNLANVINDAFLSPMREYIPLSPCNGVLDTDTESDLIVTEESVFKKLSALIPTKAPGPDDVPGWLLKENADILERPITTIVNSSFRETRVPKSWKRANIIPIPKQKPISDVNKHLRPISLTPILSKLAEDYIVDEFVKPAVLKKVDPQQFGTVPGSCTNHALISILHSWYSSTDGNGATVRVVLLDLRKHLIL